MRYLIDRLRKDRMTPFLKKTSKCWFVTVHDEGGHVSTGSRAARATTTPRWRCRICSRRSAPRLAPWDIIDAIVERRVKIERVFDFYPDRLEELRAELADEDLAPAIDAWDANLDVREGGRSRAGDGRALSPPGELALPEGRRACGCRCALDAHAGVLQGEARRGPGSSTNKRRHAAGWNSLLTSISSRRGSSSAIRSTRSRCRRTTRRSGRGSSASRT
jgi:hypothetical protein